WLAFGVLALGLLIATWRRWQRVVAAGLVMLPSLAAMIWATLHERGELSGGRFHAAFPNPIQSIAALPSHAGNLIQGDLDIWVVGVVMTTTLVLLALAVLRSDGQIGLRPVLLPSSLLLLYLVLPTQVDRPFHWWYIAQRIPTMLVPLLLL